MRLKRLILPVIIGINLFSFEFDGSIQSENPLVLEFGVTKPFASELVGKMSHEKLFSCTPSIDGISEYRQNSIIFYTKDLHAGMSYVCQSGTSKTQFSTNKFSVIDVRKIDDKKYIISFIDDVNLSDVISNLKVDNAKFTAQMASKTDVIISLENPIKSPTFSLPKDFKSSYGAKLLNEWKLNYKDTKNDEATFKNIKEAKTLVLADPITAGLDDGRLSIRLLLKDWINLDSAKKFIKIEGIDRFSLGEMTYIYGQNRELYPKDANYYIDIISDEFKPQTDYKVKILPGFGDEYLLVRDEKIFSVKTPDLPAFVNFINNQPYISSVGAIGIKSANVPNLKVVVEKLTDENYRYFLNFDNQNIQNYTKQIISKNYELDGAKNEILEHKIKLDFAGATDGVYLISAYYDKDKKVQKAVYLSDIAINAKVSKDELFVFANRLGENIMLANANVKIYDNKNHQISTGATNDEGVFIFKQKDIFKDVSSVVVSLGKEQNFLIINQNERLNERAFYPNKEANETINAYTYFASNIIRPTDAIKGVVYLKNDEFKPLKNMPIKLLIKDPQNKKINEFVTNSNDFGVLSFEQNLTSELTGRFSLDIIYASKVIKTEPFFVESFVPARIKNEIILSKTSVKNNEILPVKLQSTYLFGSPASGLVGNTEIAIFNDEYKNDEYKNFKFSDDTIKKITYKTSYKDTRLDKNGSAELLYPVFIEGNAQSTLSGVLTFNINDDGKNISSVKDFKIYPFDSIVGIKSDKNFINPDESVNFSTVVLDTTNFKSKNTTLKFDIKRVVWEYNMDERGYLKWFKNLENIDSFYKDLQNFEYKFSQSGEYVIVAQDPISNASASYDISVSGYNFSTLSPTKELSTAQIKLNAKTYKQGETLSADISSAIKEGLALITLEANGVKAYKLASIKNHSANVKFTIWENFNGGYINANIYRLADQANTPFRAYAKSYIKPNVEQKTMTLALDTPKFAKSNQKVKINIKVEPNADISLFAVDLGVLNITQQQSPNPLGFFTRQLNDGVFDYDIYSKLTGYIVSGKLLNFGGDMVMMAAMKTRLAEESSPVDSKNIKTFIKMARLKADENANATYELEIPEGLNSAIRVDVIATNDDKISSTSKVVTIKDDIILKPSVISYMLNGDDINATLRVINTTNEPKNISLSQSGKNINVTLNQTELSLEPMQSKSINLGLKPLNIGKANFEITAKSKDEIFISKTALDVVNPYPVSTYAKSLSIDKNKKISLPKGYEKVRIDASTQISSLLASASTELIHYPYGCSEQRSSRLLALLNAKTQNEIEEKDRLRFIEYGIYELLKMQKDSGVFGYWDETSYINAFASIYAADVLFELQKAGYKIDKTAQKRTIKGLKNLNFEDSTQALYATYVLSKYSSVDRSTLNRLYDSKEYTKSTLDRYLMASALKISGFEDEANSIIGNIKSSENLGIKNGQNFNSDMRDMAFILYLHASNFAKNSYSDELANNIISNIDALNSTQERAFALRALSEYFKNLKDEKGSFSLVYNGDKMEFFTPSIVNISPKDGRFEIVPSKSMFINISSKAYIPLEIKHKKEPKELDIYRTFVDKNGKEILLKNLKQNDVIFSKIELNSKSSVRNGVINEIVSPCLEPINETITNFNRTEQTQNTLNLEYQSIKDDRILSFYNLDKSGILYTPFRVVLSGKCSLGAVKTENMYNESQSDYDLSQKHFIVK
ncbi:alpha-2-macroglobulin family protein [Campylobacter mucosalis]|uniref:Alpha-2-macroglobulin domain-containing protein n=1 Tax=Campylobacter mucosalis CCUG 21559 TaxID=1032067 RepID=A0A6G5QH13_9BACT|nr:alpha-2-macroglobulin [Campylobacter mucosalis]QCD44922.1 alpha-2-macroglobulin domain-containing protein [Campylobacter mucosalis CCUG 21559]